MKRKCSNPGPSENNAKQSRIILLRGASVNASWPRSLVFQAGLSSIIFVRKRAKIPHPK